MNSNWKYIVEGNWDEVKGTIQKYWGKLTDDDMEKIDGSYKELKGYLRKIYGYTMAEVEDEISEFFNSSDLERFKKQAARRIEEIKSIALSTLEEYGDKIKDKTLAAEQAIVDYTTKNPFTTVGIAAAFGLLIGCVMKCRK